MTWLMDTAATFVSVGLTRDSTHASKGLWYSDCACNHQLLSEAQTHPLLPLLPSLSSSSPKSSSASFAQAWRPTLIVLKSSCSAFTPPFLSVPMLCLEVFDGPSISSWRLFGLCSFVCYFLNVCVCGFLFHNSVLITLFCPERDLDWITLMKQRLPPFTHPYRWF